MTLRVLVACEFSGRVRDAFRKRGHYAVSCDVLPSEAPGPHYRGDIRDVLSLRGAFKLRWDLLIAHPPCTRLTNAGARWLIVPPPGRTLAEMWAELDKAAKFYCLLRDSDIPHKAVENPIMHKHARALVHPGFRQVVQPWWFGEKAFKATGLELINLPPLTPTNKLTPPKPGTEEHKRWSKVHRESPGPNRGKLRSLTYQGIADAMAAQWGDYLSD